MSSQFTYVRGAIFLVLFVVVSYVFIIPSAIFTPHIQQYDSNWKGWAEIDTIFSFGDSYTSTGFQLTKQQPRPEDPFGNPTYNPKSPYLKWIQYLTMTCNDSQIETYNFAVNGATVDRDLINRGSAFSTQVGNEFLPNYARQGNHTEADGKKGRGSKGGKNKSSGNETASLADWEPEMTLFSVWFGINDVVFSNKSEVLFDQIFESYRKTLHQLQTARAQNFLLLNIPPLHRGPHQPNKSPLATSISSWNARLARLAASFGSTYPETRVLLFDAYGLLNRILDKPGDFGPTRHLGNVKDQCGKYGGKLGGQEEYERECEVPYDQYFWRDGLHVTFPVHEVVAEGVAGLLRGG